MPKCENSLTLRLNSPSVFSEFIFAISKATMSVTVRTLSSCGRVWRGLSLSVRVMLMTHVSAELELLVLATIQLTQALDLYDNGYMQYEQH
eukprot:5039638-Pleurochrysis_carterae.AAC.1